VRLVNVVTGEVEWEPVAYIPVVRNQKEPAAKLRARARRNGILQRVLYLAFRTTIGASRTGVLVERGGMTYVGFPRVLLYLCDQPEEKAVLCLKGGNCKFPCSSCLATADIAGAPTALDAVERCAVDTLGHQIEAESLVRRRVDPERLAHLEALDGAHSRLPALAGMYGLSTEPFLLYKTVGFDCLHVRWCLLFEMCFSLHGCPLSCRLVSYVERALRLTCTLSVWCLAACSCSIAWPRSPYCIGQGPGSGCHSATRAPPRACVSAHMCRPLPSL